MSSERQELVCLIRRIQALALELNMLDTAGPELETKERLLDQLRWRLAVVARRSATDVGVAA